MKKYFLLLFLIILSFATTVGQEILTGLSENPAIKQSNQRPVPFKSSVYQSPAPVLLPFFDNFKQKSIYPDTSLWMDNNVFINNDFAEFPPTWNVATFDAINASGDIYPDANFLQFQADFLTSKPIRLDSVFSPQPAALSPADSIYLSFYYQPQGRGNDPQLQDSLVLEFGHYTGQWIFTRVDSITVSAGIYGADTLFPGDILISPCDETWEYTVTDTLYPDSFVTLPCDSVFTPESNWKRVWATKGMPLDTFLVKNNDFYFRQVMIPITDTTFFRNDFQFRFFNFASISNDNLQSWQSNCDHWNIDYVYLNKGRTRADSTHEAISFAGNAPSFLVNYQSIPFYQYKKGNPFELMKLGLEMYISNLDNSNQTAHYYYEVRDDLGNLVFSWDGGSGDLQPFNQSGYTTISSFAFPPVNGTFPPFGNRDSIYFDITHYLEGDLQLGLTDTLRFRQNFHNYFAYDDGTPEFGYGLTPAGAKLAYRFDLIERDTLRAVQMYFNKTLTGANNQFFDLVIWKDLNGRPNDTTPDGVLYYQERLKPVFTDNLNEFATYFLNEPVPVQGTFYVGWIQRTGHNLNLGFDAGNDASSFIYYKVTNNWAKTSFKGALMIRPLLGESLANAPQPEILSAKFLIAPNPTKNGIVNLKYNAYGNENSPHWFIEPDEETTRNLLIEVFSIMGQKVFEGDYAQQIDLSHLNNGIYIVCITNISNRSSNIQKLIIRK